jgi:hypothetical protein
MSQKIYEERRSSRLAIYLFDFVWIFIMAWELQNVGINRRLVGFSLYCGFTEKYLNIQTQIELFENIHL